MSHHAFTITVAHCARCHTHRHYHLEFKPLTHPIEVSDQTFTHWAPCPDNGEPILVAHRNREQVVTVPFDFGDISIPTDALGNLTRQIEPHQRRGRARRT